jgi:hypothetical protein
MIISSRTDGLGRRLLHLLDTIFLSQTYDKDFWFLWQSALTRKQSKYGSILHCPISFESLFDRHPSISDNLDIRYIRSLEKYRKKDLTERDLLSNEILFFTEISEEINKKINPRDAKIYSKNFKSLMVKKEILDRVNGFSSQKELDQTLGVHYRSGDISNPDHYRNPRFCPPEEMIELIIKNVNINEYKKIFLMSISDDHSNRLLTLLKERLPDKKIIEYNKLENSFSPKECMHGNQENIKDAFVDMMILSRCNTIFRCPAAGCLSHLAQLIGCKKTIHLKK